MRVEIHPSWEKVLQPLFETASFGNLEVVLSVIIFRSRVISPRNQALLLF